MDNKITTEQIDSLVKEAQYYVFPNTTLTICCITLTNGFTVSGESACVDPTNFNKIIGEEIAFKNAKEKIWLLEGYLLNYKLNNK